MKTKYIALIISVFAMFSAQAQESKEANNNILICNSDKVEFTKAELMECNTVSVKDQDLAVVSMVVSMSAGTSIIEIVVTGNSFSETLIEQLKKDLNYKNLYLEKVTLADGTDVGFKRFKFKE